MEILGGYLDNVMIDLNIDAIKLYESDTHLSEKTQVWKMTEKSYDKLCNTEGYDWDDDWGWWYGWIDIANFNIENPLGTFDINGRRITAWDGYDR